MKKFVEEELQNICLFWRPWTTYNQNKSNRFNLKMLMVRLSITVEYQMYLRAKLLVKLYSFYLSSKKFVSLKIF